MEIPGSRLNRGRGNNRGYNMRQGEYNMRGRYDMGPGYGSGIYWNPKKMNRWSGSTTRLLCVSTIIRIKLYYIILNNIYMYKENRDHMKTFSLHYIIVTLYYSYTIFV